MQPKRSVLAGFSAAFPVLDATIARADAVRTGWHHGMMGWSGWFFGPIMMIVFFALLIGAVMIIVRLLGADQRPDDIGQSVDRASEILRERFAKGEITKEEFEEARKTLE